MDNFGLKIEAFKQIFFEQNGYQKVIEGLQNTLIIAIAGLLIGIIIGILFFLCWLVPWNTDGSAVACVLLCIASDYRSKTYGCAGVCACVWFE